MRFFIELIKGLLEIFFKIVEKENTSDINREYKETLEKVRLVRQELDKTERGIEEWRQIITRR